VQAYRLFTLALAKKPETGAMNRLREQADLPQDAAWRLAAAYALIGQQQAAANMIKGMDRYVSEYPGLSNTYGSAERDLAMMLETLVYIGQREEAFEMLQQLSTALSSGMWMSTQTTAYSLIAVSKFLGNEKTDHEIKVRFNLDDATERNIASRQKLIEIKLLPEKESGLLKLNNESNSPLFVRIISEGVPAPGDEPVSENGIQVGVRYLSKSGEVVNVNRLMQGTDIVVEVTVTNTSPGKQLNDLALTQIFASGWEISNQRLFDQTDGQSSAFTYQDIRDDRVLTYFDLSPNQRKVFRVSLTAAYPGRYYLSAPRIEAMYDNRINSSGQGSWVEVIR
jgi:alpha-2-macroglobulin